MAVLPPKAWHAGHEAENLAKDFLQNMGFSILGQNLRLADGELDIVAMDGNIISLGLS